MEVYHKMLLDPKLGSTSAVRSNLTSKVIRGRFKGRRKDGQKMFLDPKLVGTDEVKSDIRGHWRPFRGRKNDWIYKKSPSGDPHP